MNDEGLADVAAANPFRLPRLHPGIGSLAARFASVPAVAVVAATEKRSSPSASGRGGSTLWPRLARYTWVGAGIAAGRIRYREDIVDGLENAPGVFIGILEGRNFGKLIIRVAA